MHQTQSARSSTPPRATVQQTTNVTERERRTVTNNQSPLISSNNSLLGVSVLGAILALLLTYYGSEWVSDASGWLFHRMSSKYMPSTSTTSSYFGHNTGSTLGNYNLSLIGAGFGNSGSSRLRTALSRIGLGNAYHWGELLVRGVSEHDKWYKIAMTKDKTERQRLLREVLRPYRTAVDFPASLYYKDLMEMYPNAKVILNVGENMKDAARKVQDSARDTASSVQDSVRDTARSVQDSARSAQDKAKGMMSSTTSSVSHLGLPTAYFEANSFSDLLMRSPIMGPGLWFFFKYNPMGVRMAKHFNQTYFHLYHRDPIEFAKAYNAWIEEVRRSVPADRLMEYNFTQGWEPFSKMFNVEKPSDAFPTVDEEESTTWFPYVLSIMGWLTMLLPITVGLWLLSKLFSGGSSSTSWFSTSRITSRLPPWVTDVNQWKTKFTEYYNFAYNWSQNFYRRLMSRSNESNTTTSGSGGSSNQQQSTTSGSTSSEKHKNDTTSSSSSENQPQSSSTGTGGSSGSGSTTTGVTTTTTHTVTPTYVTAAMYPTTVGSHATQQRQAMT